MNLRDASAGRDGRSGGEGVVDTVQPIRILLLSQDPAFVDAVMSCCCSLAAVVRHTDDAQVGIDTLAAGEFEMAVVDAALGFDALADFVRRVRLDLCADWLPLLVAGDPVDLRPRIRAVASGMVDRVIAKPLEHEELHEGLAAARRAVSLRRAFDSTLDRVSESVIVTDGSGRIRTFNAASRRMFQWGSGEMLGQNVRRLMPEPIAHGHDRHLAQYRRTGHANVIGKGRLETGQRRDGSHFQMHLTVSDISDSHGTRYVGVIRDLTRDREAEDLRQRVRFDAMTGLLNAAHARELVREACDRANEGDAGFALVYLDLDRFKPVNDVHGHAVGDQVLKAVAHRLRHGLGADDLVARMGGDEFLALLRHVDRSETAQAVAQRLQLSITQPIVIGDHTVGVGVSAGIAVHGIDGSTAESLLMAADMAMYARKRRGASEAGPSLRESGR